MTNQQEIVKAWLAELNAQQLEDANRFFADDFVYHGRERDFTQPEIAEILRQWFQAGAAFELDQVIEDGEDVAVRWRCTVGDKEHRGIGMGTIRDGLVQEWWQQVTD